MMTRRVRGLWYNVIAMNERIEVTPNVCHGSPVCLN